MTVYALAHPDGRWLYHLPQPTEHRGQTPVQILGDALPMQLLRGDWWVAPQRVEVITTEYATPPKRVGYELRDPSAASERFPLRLTLAEWGASESDLLYELYNVVTEAQPNSLHVYEGPYVALEGREPPGPGEPAWVAQLPYALAERAEYLHLFPGHIPGLIDYLTAKFRAMPRVDFVSMNFNGRSGLHVSVKVPYETPRTTFRRDASRRTGKPLKTGRHVPELVSRRIDLPVPDRISGATYAEALAAWNEAVAFWTRQVEEVSVAACNHCNGTGRVDIGGEKYRH